MCDRCGTELIARPDDTEQAVRKRLEAFHRQTLPVATFYKAKSLLREVDGIGDASIHQIKLLAAAASRVAKGEIRRSVAR